MTELLRELKNEFGKTVVMVTHDLGTIGRYSSKLLYLDKRIVFYGTYEEFCQSEDVTRIFGAFAQHVICHRHGAPTDGGLVPFPLPRGGATSSCGEERSGEVEK